MLSSLSKYPKAIQTICKIFTKSKEQITVKQQIYFKNYFSEDKFFTKLCQIHADQGCKELIQILNIIQYQENQKMQINSIYWIYILKGLIRIDNQDYYQKNSILLQNKTKQFEITKGTILIILQTQKYQKMLKNNNSRTIKLDILHIQKLPYFSLIEFKELSIFYKLIQKKLVTKNTIVYKQGELAKYFYIIHSGSFVIKKCDKKKRKQKQITLMVESDMFGEECLNYKTDEQKGTIIINERYISEVVCTSSNGIVLMIQNSMFNNYPLKKYNLHKKIYKLYEGRRENINGVTFDEQQKQKQDQKQQDKQIEQYFSKLYRNKSYVKNYKQNIVDPKPTFYKKHQIQSMKLKLKYETILQKIKKINQYSRTALEIPRKSPKMYSRNLGNLGLQRSTILRQLSKKLESHQRSQQRLLISTLMFKTELQNQQKNILLNKKQKRMALTQRMKLQTKSFDKQAIKLVRPQTTTNKTNTSFNFLKTESEKEELI